MSILSISSKPIMGVAVVLILAIGVGLVFAQQTGKPADMSNTASVTVVSSMSASPIPISAARGSSITITLPSNQTTGYSWRIANKYNAAVVKFVRSSYITQKSGANVVGQSGVEAWSFQAVGRGSTTLLLEYVRSWEKNARPAKKQAFMINVK